MTVMLPISTALVTVTIFPSVVQGTTVSEGYRSKIRHLPYDPSPLNYALPKTCLLLGVAWGFHVTVTPPNASKVGLAARSQSSLQERLLLGLLPLSKVFAYLATANELRSVFVDNTCDITWQLVIGFLVCVASGMLRKHCYQLLGARFTFDLKTHPEASHDGRVGQPAKPPLVTAGPYSFVRHPSYIAAMTMWWGFILVYLDPSSSLGDILARRLAGWHHTLLVAVCVLNPFLLVARVRREERMLIHEFGEEWERYTRRIKWRLFPGVW
ncbi:hypothetical protein BKA62DRAFT_718660 [Auriculariales sp. MPI-PUGE-AT-0066]|nr:hypothetical protein BKA62DRAFT_718660 [Auriculariales sp. MPI-PUGE-AT-0066]